ncbi:hypothetical protein [Allosphingosinicella vermicomposti]|uniref:hypothetical protein n=1 Tax=Allosphingosinicella vermicomposti TaxID=614671 RepID=UPI00131A503A|nr:hypothetical protein [Allosphingosinicella vermicomposti]
MFSFTFSAVLALAAAQADPVIPARKAFAQCLTKVTRDHLAKKDEPEAFDAAVKPACATEEAALRTALINSDLARGFKRADAEEGANLQIEDYLAVAMEDYRGFRESGTQPN